MFLLAILIPACASSSTFGGDPGPARIALAPEHEATAWVAHGRRWRGPAQQACLFQEVPGSDNIDTPAQPDGTPCSEFLATKFPPNVAPSPSTEVTSGSLCVWVCVHLAR